MNQDTDYQQSQKFDIIKTMFVDPASQNYVVARWCFQMSLDMDFLWNAVHCLEKLMKAVMLFNGQSVKFHGHDITKLYDKLEDIAGNLLPDELVKPKEVDSNSWRDESAKAFLFRLYKSGLADNRYHVFEHTRRADDLYKLDQLYFAIFRLCCFLDYPQLGESRYGQSDTTNREHLEKNPNYNPNSNPTRLKELMEGYNPELVHAAKNENYPFSPEFQHQRITCGSSRQTPVLRRTIIDPDKKYPDKKRCQG